MTEKMKIYALQLSHQEVYVLLRTIASATSLEEREGGPPVKGDADPQVRNWLVDRLLMLLPEEERPHVHIES